MHIINKKRTANSNHENYPTLVNPQVIRLVQEEGPPRTRPILCSLSHRKVTPSLINALTIHHLACQTHLTAINNLGSNPSPIRAPKRLNLSVQTTEPPTSRMDLEDTQMDIEN